MKSIKKFFQAILVIDLIVINIAVGFLIYTRVFADKESQTQKIQTVTKTNELQERVDEEIEDESVIFRDECGEDCKLYIDQAIKEGLAEIDQDSSATTNTTTTITTTKKSVFYYPIPGSGETKENEWADIPGTEFYFDKADYEGYKESYFEATMRLFNGNGKAFLRIYDETHDIAVVGSEVETSSQTSTAIESGKLYFWEGRNLYKIQGKSLTADTTIFDGGRIKVITEN